MQLPDGLHYTTEHEWLRLEGGEAVIGISYAVASAAAILQLLNR